MWGLGRKSLLVVAVSLLAAASARAQVDVLDSCSPAVPERLAPVVPGVAPTPRIELRVLVGLDGVSEQQATGIMAGAAKAYAPLGVDLTVAAYRPITLTSSESGPALRESREKLGPRRPPWTHLVMTLTNKQLTPAQGLASCVGGIRSDDQAFAIGQYIEPNTGGGVMTSRPDNGAKLVAHELGHLVGAEHHHGNCNEGVLDGDPTATCTLMMPSVPHITAMRFGVLESALIRAHVEDFAKPLPPVPAPSADLPGQPAAPSAGQPPKQPAAPARRPSACQRARAQARRARAALRRARAGRSRRAVRRARKDLRAAERRVRLRCT